MTTEETVALVTGANKGLGLETCRQLARRVITVLMGARDIELGRDAAGRLKSEGLTVEPVQLDVTRADHIAQIGSVIETRFGRLDILVNNAGMIHPEESLFANSSEQISLQALRETFEVNFFGQVALTQALLPLIKKSPAGRIVNVSSILGSLTLHSKESSEATQIKPLAYDASKTALNQFTVHLAASLNRTPIKVNAAHPGWVKTDLGSRRAPMGVEDGAKTAVRLATIGPDGPTGKFFHFNEEVPW
ncbi:short-chain dehydrogenase [Desulfosarcina alkanivorans]|uniref:Short-chain dehydrogenase n=1 Tax=Desulfosarcina alkanivorans TaxID=571177 RepID=A0A5K7YLR3_9BACT|nr:SDR family oxidoreductase [Desulfosarcina alkanivorans]BBO69305.1 short-chain dehydrogenase [Desulfosarcina alkanivorans]